MGKKNAITPTKYSNDLVFRIYELAKNGYSKKKIANACGITRHTLKIWFEKHEVCKKAYLKGAKLFASEGNQTTTFTNYVSEHLPKKIQKKWDKIMVLGNRPRGPERVQAFLEAQDKVVQQYLFIHSLISCNFQKTKALKKIGLTYNKLHSWMQDVEFSTMVDFVHELRGDFFEDHLSQLVSEGDAKALIFVNRTFNRKRGYGDRLDVNVDGHVNYHHTISIDDTEMKLEDKKKLLNQIRTKQIESKVIDVKPIE